MLGSEFLGLSVLESGLPSSELPRGGLACLPMMPGLARPGPRGGTRAPASACVKQIGNSEGVSWGPGVLPVLQLSGSHRWGS